MNTFYVFKGSRLTPPNNNFLSPTIPQAKNAWYARWIPNLAAGLRWPTCYRRYYLLRMSRSLLVGWSQQHEHRINAIRRHWNPAPIVWAKCHSWGDRRKRFAEAHRRHSSMWANQRCSPNPTWSHWCRGVSAHTGHDYILQRYWWVYSCTTQIHSYKFAMK